MLEDLLPQTGPRGRGGCLVLVGAELGVSTRPHCVQPKQQRPGKGPNWFGADGGGMGAEWWWQLGRLPVTARSSPAGKAQQRVPGALSPSQPRSTHP